MTETFTIAILRDDILRILLFGFWGFTAAMLLTPIYTNLAYKYKWWKRPRTETMTGEHATVFNRLHAKKHKRNIPSMAGIVFLLAITLVTMALGNLSRSQTYLPLAALLGAGAVGLIDDIINLKGVAKGILGLSARLKFLLITLVAALGAWYFYYKLGYESFHLTFAGDVTIGWLLMPLFMLVVVGTANAVNMSDGLDGLAGGLAVTAYTAFGVIALLQGNVGIAAFCMTIVGALLAYTWFNIYPARFFMGDVGSFALGTGLGVVAMLTDTLVLLPIIGGVFVIEAGSVIIQLFSKRLFGKKLFLVTPIHHHFEALGWPETKVTMRFWIFGQVFGVIGLILAFLGGHI